MDTEPSSGHEGHSESASGEGGGVNLLILGVVLALLGLVIITAATFQFDMVKDHVFRAHPDFAPYVAAVGYVFALSGLVMALVHFIREG
jgi:hypothetical protein